MNPGYEAATLEVFGDLVDRGIVFRQLEAEAHWSIENQTALAEAVPRVRGSGGSLGLRGLSRIRPRSGPPSASSASSPSLLIWTTTHWTLVANRAIAVHERGRYALVEGGGSLGSSPPIWSRRWHPSRDSRMPTCWPSGDGAALLGLAYGHPFVERSTRWSPRTTSRSRTAPDGCTRKLLVTAPTTTSPESARAGGRLSVRGDGTYDDTVPEWLEGLDVGLRTRW